MSQNQINETGQAKIQNVVDRVIRISDVIAISAGYVAVVALVGITCLMVAQVSVSLISRFTPAVRGDIPIAWEYGAYLMGAVFMLGLGLSLRAGRHIRLDIIVDRASPKARRMLEVVSSVCTLVFAIYLTFSLIRAAVQAYQLGTTSISSGAPVWIPFVMFAIGSAVFALQLFTRTIAAIFDRTIDDLSLRLFTGTEE